MIKYDEKDNDNRKICNARLESLTRVYYVNILKD